MIAMETRRLQLLLELSRLGSMRAVADGWRHHVDRVAADRGARPGRSARALIEPDGRRVRLTPAGRRLADHAVTILAAVDAARLDLDPDAEPAGTVRVAGFATAIRRSLLPVVAGLAASHPRVRLLIREHEPAEALALLAGDDVDLALTYDYNLAPATLRPHARGDAAVVGRAGASAVPAGRPTDAARGDAVAVVRRFRDHDWIVNSRNTADEDVVRTLASMAGFAPRIVHRADSLDLVQDLIVAGLGVGLLPARPAGRAGVRAAAPGRPGRPAARLRRDPPRPGGLAAARARRRSSRRAGAPLSVVSVEEDESPATAATHEHRGPWTTPRVPTTHPLTSDRTGWVSPR